MSDDQVLVSTDVLRAKSDEVNESLSAVRTILDELDISVLETKSFWRGQAADTHRRKYEHIQANAEEILTRFSQQVQNLQQMAGVYEASEQELEETVASLPSEVLQ